MMSASGNKQRHVINVGLLVAFRNRCRELQRWTARDNCRASDIGLTYTHTLTIANRLKYSVYSFFFSFLCRTLVSSLPKHNPQVVPDKYHSLVKVKKKNATNACHLSRWDALVLPFRTLYTDVFRGTRHHISHGTHLNPRLGCCAC